MLLLVIFASQNLASDQLVTSGRLDYSASIYSEEEWLNIARKAVEGFGMIGEREHEEWALMTRGSYLTMLGGGGSPQDRQAPLFVYQVFGNIPVFQMYGGLDGPARNIGGITLVFDGEIGAITNWSAYPNEIIAQGNTGLNMNIIPIDSGFSYVDPAPTAASSLR